MPILPRRFDRLKSVLNHRMSNLTILTEEVEKPHNLSAMLRTCDAVGVLEAHAIFKEDQIPTFNSTAQGSQKWVKLTKHINIEIAIRSLKNMGFKIYGTHLNQQAKDYRKIDYKESTAFVLGAEKWGLSESSAQMVDELIYIPMNGMVQSLNVSVAASTLLFEALRQREEAGILPTLGEGVDKDVYQRTLFEWSYPEVATWCRNQGRSYPLLGESGEILEDLPRTLKMRC